VRRTALLHFLRQLHAQNAEKLALLSFQAKGREAVALIDDAEIRQTFGRIIGRLAHSHWWSISEVERAFDRIIGAPHWCPPQWTIDPLKVACLLRTADAAHIDARRAPIFARALTEIEQSSDVHWRFQEKLNKPYRKEDAWCLQRGKRFLRGKPPLGGCA
jgi:hypothetical protein